VNGAPFQPAVAMALGLPRSYYAEFLADMTRKRDRLVAGLAAAGFEVFAPEGTYFVTADVAARGEGDGVTFCRTLPERCGVVAIPNVVFYDDAAAGATLVRFACCKRLEVIDEAVDRLARL
jgi:N-succinyldiaminopimelate aminotransferase